MKKVLSVLLSLVLVFTMCAAMTGCGGDDNSDAAANGDPVVLHFGSTQGTTHAWYEAATTFKDTVEKNSNGSIEIQIEAFGEVTRITLKRYSPEHLICTSVLP